MRVHADPAVVERIADDEQRVVENKSFAIQNAAHGVGSTRWRRVLH